MAEYLPYVDAYGQLKELFGKIKEAAVPVKFTQDFIYTKLGLKSTSYRAMIPLLKKLGFIDEVNVPTQAYRDYRDEAKSKSIMAAKIKAGYADLFSANEYAQHLKKEELISKLITLSGVSKDDKTIPKIAGTFMELCKLANFENKQTLPVEKESPAIIPEDLKLEKPLHTKLGISYTINLNLPATADIEVFNAIFKSLKEHLLK